MPADCRCSGTSGNGGAAGLTSSCGISAGREQLKHCRRRGREPGAVRTDVAPLASWRVGGGAAVYRVNF
jgi:hypothetical protein